MPAPYLPPELLSLIIHHLSMGCEVYDPDKGLNERNARLLLAALISRDWAAAALNELYSDLRLDWVSSVGSLLLRTFEQAPELCRRVKSLDVIYATHRDFRGRWQEYDEEEPGSVGASPEEWMERRGDLLWASWNVDSEVVLAPLFGLVAKLPNLRHLSLQEFEFGFNASVVEPASTVLQNLTSLRCYGFTPRSLGTLLSFTPNLEKLDGGFSVIFGRMLADEKGDDAERPCPDPFLPKLRHFRTGFNAFNRGDGNDLSLIKTVLDATEAQLEQLDIGYSSVLDSYELLDTAIFRRSFPALHTLSFTSGVGLGTVQAFLAKTAIRNLRHRVPEPTHLPRIFAALPSTIVSVVLETVPEGNEALSSAFSTLFSRAPTALPNLRSMVIERGAMTSEQQPFGSTPPSITALVAEGRDVGIKVEIEPWDDRDENEDEEG
ncbi:hypothetical protein MNV49_006945 [Pseudohyphozyma bogoriensis]|nr:hypothetical protein MNV49_006945 [Pseudohyphozyma bogoriensis]